MEDKSSFKDWKDRAKAAIKEREIKKTLVSHWHENKKLYATAATCIVGTYILAHRGEVTQTVKQINIFSPHSSVIAHLEDRTNHAIPVRCKETGEVFGSLNRAAAANKINQGLVSRQLSGDLENAGGLHFERL